MGDIDVKGSKNRTAGRNYYEVKNANNVAGRDVIHVNLPPPRPQDDPPLAQSQRCMLNKLVDEIIELTGEKPRTIWLRVYAPLGVDKISEIRKSQYDNAQGILFTIKKIALEAQHCNKLISEIFKLNIDKKILSHYCRTHFGETFLKKLERSALQQILDHFINTQPFSMGYMDIPMLEELKEEYLADKTQALRRSWINLPASIAAIQFIGILLFLTHVIVLFGFGGITEVATWFDALPVPILHIILPMAVCCIICILWGDYIRKTRLKIVQEHQSAIEEIDRLIRCKKIFK